jgi:hypothetical protein
MDERARADGLRLLRAAKKLLRGVTRATATNGIGVAHLWTSSRRVSANAPDQLPWLHGR